MDYIIEPTDEQLRWLKQSSENPVPEHEWPPFITYRFTQSKYPSTSRAYMIFCDSSGTDEDERFYPPTGQWCKTSDALKAIKDSQGLKDSDEWCDLMGLKVIDPDGWDRGNFEKSWSEKTSFDEFMRRYNESTSFTDHDCHSKIEKYRKKYSNV